MGSEYVPNEFRMGSEWFLMGSAWAPNGFLMGPNGFQMGSEWVPITGPRNQAYVEERAGATAVEDRGPGCQMVDPAAGGRAVPTCTYVYFGKLPGPGPGNRISRFRNLMVLLPSGSRI